MEKLPPPSWRASDRLHNLVVDLFEDARHDRQHGRPHLEQVLRQRVETLRVGDRYPQGKVGVVEHSLVDVAQGQERDCHIAAAQREQALARLNVGSDVRVRQDDSFEYTRRSRRVQEARRVFRTDLKGPGAKRLDDVAPSLELV